MRTKWMSGRSVNKVKKTLIIALILLTVLLIILVSSCHGYNTPPSVSYVKNKFILNHNEINVIVEYMINAGYEDIYISSADGFMIADLMKIQICDESFLAAVKKLIQDNAYIHISKNGNTISFLQWRGIKDIGCGVAYSINGINAPDIQFMTELVPIFDAGWFYYVSDYNKWRSEQSEISNS